jgi:hypothetical protein
VVMMMLSGLAVVGRRADVGVHMAEGAASVAVTTGAPGGVGGGGYFGRSGLFRLGAAAAAAAGPGRGFAFAAVAAAGVKGLGEEVGYC